MHVKCILRVASLLILNGRCAWSHGATFNALKFVDEFKVSSLKRPLFT